MINRRPTGNIQRDISDLFQEVSALANAVNQNQKMGSARNEGKEGDIRFVRREDGKSYLMCKGRNDWETTFQGCFQLAGNNTPLLHLESLSVDNLYAKMFTINQTNAYNGNWLMSSGTAIVESSTATTITFKDQTNLNLCPFAVNDKCEIRQISADKSLTIKLSQFTISSVSGRTATVVYESGHPIAKAGDIVVQRGNSSNTARQNAVYFSINDDYSPYVDFYSGLTGFTFGTPNVRIGNLTGISDVTFGSLTGNGFYGDNVYLKGKIIISNPEDINTSDINNDAGWVPAQNYTSGTTFPSTPSLNDIHRYTGTTGGGYYTNTLYRYNGSSWEILGQAGTYIDNTGVYTGTVAADQVIAGTLTGFTIQTAASGARITMVGSSLVATSGGSEESITLGAAASTVSLSMLWSDGSISIDNSGIDVTGGDISADGALSIGSTGFIINTSGQITKINNVVTSGYVPISNGTHYEPRALTAADVTNAVSTGGSYSNPSWITSLAYSKLSSVPTASGSQDGILSSTNWTTFNNKVSSVTLEATGNVYYVATSSGGSPTKSVGAYVLKVNGVTVDYVLRVTP